MYLIKVNYRLGLKESINLFLSKVYAIVFCMFSFCVFCSLCYNKYNHFIAKVLVAGLRPLDGFSLDSCLIYKGCMRRVVKLYYYAYYP